MIDYRKFRLSLQRLEEQHHNLAQPESERSRLDEEGIRESVIRRFKTCHDCLWKVLKRYLTEELGVADAPQSPKPIFRMAAENGLLAAPTEQWLGYADARVGAAHDYDGEKAKACLQLVPEFLTDAIGLYRTMTGKTLD